MILLLFSIVILIESVNCYFPYNGHNIRYAIKNQKNNNVIVKKMFTFIFNKGNNNNEDNGILGLPFNPTVTLYDEYEDEVVNENIIVSNNISSNDIVTNDKKNVNRNNEINEIKEQMKIQLLYAFDNLYENDIDNMLDVIWSSNKNEILNIRLKLIELTKIANNINNILIRGDFNYGYENLVDELRIVRSQIRMYSNVPVITNKVFRNNSKLSNNDDNNTNNDNKNIIHNIKNWFEGIFSRK